MHKVLLTHENFMQWLNLDLYQEIITWKFGFIPKIVTIFSYRIESDLIDDILQVQKIQKEAQNGCEESVFRLKRGSRPLIPGEDEGLSKKKRQKLDEQQNDDILNINPEGDIINNTLATLAAALVWLALQSDELVSTRKYSTKSKSAP